MDSIEPEKRRGAVYEIPCSSSSSVYHFVHLKNNNTGIHNKTQTMCCN